MDFSFAGHHDTEQFSWFADGLKTVMQGHGHAWVDDPDDASLVINFFPSDQPKPFRRRAQAVFLASVSALDSIDRPIPDAYPLLVRSLANLTMTLVEEGDPDPHVHFITPEQGHYVVAGDSDRSHYFERIYERIEPLATSRMVIDNIFNPDLPEELWNGDEITESIYRAGHHLGELDLLPAPFPMDELLSERDVRHLKRLFGIGGLSYGNVSARLNENDFWMSASEVLPSSLGMRR